MNVSRRHFLRHAVLVSAGSFQRSSFPGRTSAADSELRQPLLGNRERIVFFGDSITQGGSYVAYLETLMRIRFPKSSLEIHNHGISSETISGTSEPDHDPRRPWAHERFARDVADWHPTLLFSCFGMNDGNYHPFDENRFSKYREGILRLIDRAKNEAGARRLILCTPPPFDAYQRKNGDPKAIHYGYKYPATNYDETLHRYSQWLLTLREKNETVIDLHGPMNRHLAARRKGKVSFTLMPDAVHPDSTGHAVMAIVMARQIGLPGPRDTATIAAGFAGVVADRGTISITEKTAEGLAFEWNVPPAWAFGGGVDAESLALENFDSTFNSLSIRLDDPAEGEYELSALSQPGEKPVVRCVSGAELSKGVSIDPLESATSPARVASEALAEAVSKHRHAASAAWRNRAMKLPRAAEDRGPQLEELAMEAAAAAALSAQAGMLVPGPLLKITKVRA